MTPSTPTLARRLAATALAALLAGTATAQDAPAPDAPDAPAPDAAEDPAAQAGDEVETGSEADADAEVQALEAEEPSADAPALGLEMPQVPEPEVLEIVRETHGDWEVRCLPDGTDCFLYQLALDDDENPVAEFSMVALPAGSEAVAGVNVVTPLGTLLPAGVVMQIDQAEPRQYEFTFCSQVGCFARFGLTNASVDAMKRGRVARLQLVSIGAPDQPVSLDVSLMGFTAAYDSLSRTE